MAGLADFRAQHPEYNDMPDATLVDSLYRKFYSDMPRDQFDAKMGLAPERQSTLDPVNAAIENIGTGAYKGLSYAAGTPRMIADQTSKWAADMRAKDAERRAALNKRFGLTEPARPPPPDFRNLLPTAEDVQKNVIFGPDSVMGVPEYKPTTPAGRVVQTAVAGGTAGLMGGVGGAALGTIGGAAQQGAAEAGLPEWAQMAAGLGIPLVAGGGAALARPGALKAVEGSIRNLTAADLTEAGRLMRDAKAAGTNLTWPEAVNQVTNGGAKRLMDVQRVVEQSAGGSPTMSAFMARRAPGNAAAMQRQLDKIGPDLSGQALGDVPGSLQAAAERGMRGIKKAVTDASKPYYDTAKEAVPVGSMTDQMLDLLNTPTMKQVWDKAQNIAKDERMPIYHWIQQDEAGNITGIKNIPDANTGKYMEQAFDDLIAEANKGVTPGVFTPQATRYLKMKEEFRGLLRQGNPALAQADFVHGQNMRGSYEPSLRGPLGQLAEAPPTLAGQRRVIAPAGEQGVLDPAQINFTARQIGRQSPTALRDWVRINIKSLFSEATQENIPGANQYGGAKFRAQTMGNTDQAANLKALVTSLPGGNTIWPGYKRLMEIFEGQGKRQPPGSMTEFNKQITEDLGGGKINLQVISKVQDAIQRYRYGGNAGSLAEMFTDPAYADMWKTLALAPRRMARAPLGVLTQPQIETVRGR